MNSAIGEVLPLAIGIAVSPVPIIAAILMLLSPNAKSTSIGFMCGWVLGIAVAATVFTMLSSVLPENDDESKPVGGIVLLLLGAALLHLALRQWRSRPADGAQPEMPKWMTAIDSFTPVRGFGLGFLLSAVNPKNLLLGAAAGVTVGQAALGGAGIVAVIAIFTVIGSCSVALPVLAYLLAPQRWAGPLQSLREWLTRNNATVMAVLLLVIGVVVIGKGIGKF